MDLFNTSDTAHVWYDLLSHPKPNPSLEYKVIKKTMRKIQTLVN